MGSINPVLVLNSAIEKRGEALAKMYAGSITLGVGQFCTNPGLLIGLNGEKLDSFINKLSTALKDIAPSSMLTKGIADAYSNGLKESLAQKGVKFESAAEEEVSGSKANPTIASTSGENFISNPKLTSRSFWSLFINY